VIQTERLEEVSVRKTERVEGEVWWREQEKREVFYAVRRPPEDPVAGRERKSFIVRGKNEESLEGVKSDSLVSCKSTR